MRLKIETVTDLKNKRNDGIEGEACQCITKKG